MPLGSLGGLTHGGSKIKKNPQFLGNTELNGLTSAVNSLSLLLYFIVVVALASLVLFVFS